VEGRTHESTVESTARRVTQVADGVSLKVVGG
jgi:hypothetical protein